MKKFNRLLIKSFVAVSILISTSGCDNYKSNFGNNINLPGKYSGFTLLPNGWKLTPAGSQIGVGNTPLNLIVSNDEKYAITSNSGLPINTLSVVDLSSLKEIQRVIINKTWIGLAFNEDNTKLFSSGGYNDLVYIYNFNEGKLQLKDSILIKKDYPKEIISVSGIAYWKEKNFLLVVSKESNSLYFVNLKNKQTVKKIPLKGKCYDVIINHSGKFAYVSVWEKASVAEIDLNKMVVTKFISVGNHPCNMEISGDDKRLFVTNANNNTTSVIDLIKKKETEKLLSALSPAVPMGSTPNAVTLIADSILIIANADNNYLALFDVSKINNSNSIGLIPVGWYPTSVKYLKKSKKILVANAKGISSKANPKGPNPFGEIERKYTDYIGSLFYGTVSVINFPAQAELSDYSQQVYSNTPYVSKEVKDYSQSVIPAKHNFNASEKIKYVFYIIKENRTYDQIFGDIEAGNGDTSICIFGRKITPNQHKLAEEFTLYDNFYVDAEVSADGHNWSTAAYATDYVEKTWPVLYGDGGGSYDYEGGVPIAAPTSGYIWNNVLDHKKSFRNYGEFVGWNKDKNGNYFARDSVLNLFTCPKFPGFNLDISDIDRYKIWAADFDSLLQNNSVPNFSLIRLPNDHTWGTEKDKLSPDAYVAQNDYALGLIVDKISHSKIWPQSIIFVVEDDAQSGSDHIDAHRSTLLVVSPFIKRNFVDHNMYSTSSVLKTMELILGLPPMTQFDLSAEPILNSITDSADLKEFNRLLPEIDLNKKNLADAYGSKRSSELNLTREDAIPDIEFNEIIWKAIKGKNSVMPVPVRSAFVKVQKHIDDD